MAPKHIICPEWAETLVGLWMSLRAHCWKGCRDNQMHQGWITMFLDGLL